MADRRSAPCANAGRGVGRRCRQPPGHASTRRTRFARAQTTTRMFGSACHSAVEMPAAARELLRGRLVIRRRAPHRRGDVRAGQRQAIVRVVRRRLIREAGGVHRAIRKSPEPPAPSPVNTRPVRLAPCAAGASPTTSTRCAIAEAGDRSAPVGLVAKRGALRVRDSPQYSRKPRTAFAADDRLHGPGAAPPTARGEGTSPRQARAAASASACSWA